MQFCGSQTPRVLHGVCPAGAERRRGHQDEAIESEENDATPEIYF
jgi:hypothetical protein